jgi:hypothetical protein
VCVWEKKKFHSIDCWVLLLLCKYNQVQEKLNLISKHMNIFYKMGLKALMHEELNKVG